MIQRSIPQGRPGPRLSVLCVAAAAALALPSRRSAVEIDTGNADLKVRWDTTVRYNLGVRAKDCDENICGNGAGARRHHRAPVGPQVRQGGRHRHQPAGPAVRVRSHLQGRHGLPRQRGGLVRPGLPRRTAEGDPALLASPFGGNAYPTGPLHGDVERWNRGPSGEFLDAFVFTRVNLGDVPVNVKLGQHNIYWGESLFSLVGGVAYGQGPVDYRKAFANPGAEAKELFKPLNQVRSPRRSATVWWWPDSTSWTGRLRRCPTAAPTSAPRTS